MTLFKLALRNLLGGGLKTWLRVIVLSISFVVIVAMIGLILGVNEQATKAMIAADIGGGQYWQGRYDPQDLLNLPDAHASVPADLQSLVDGGRATSVLAVQGFMYAGGSFRPIVLRGIDPNQQVLSVPSAVLGTRTDAVPALIGSRMARETGLKAGDTATVRWRDARGTFDAAEVQIVEVMNTIVQTVDSGQVWLPLDMLRRMARMEGEATWIVLASDVGSQGTFAGWTFRDTDFLLSDLRALVRTKLIGQAIAFMMLMFLAMLTVLDTQVLSIFHRRKEIGTLMALGLTRGRVIGVFTLEGALNAVLAALAGAVYGFPLLAYMVATGIPMPASMDTMGISIGERIYPAYSAVLVTSITLLVFAVTTVVSYMPTRQIARMKATDALRGRLT
jgi:ABC-type lipoprotein release transport system permease subunit